MHPNAVFQKWTSTLVLPVWLAGLIGMISPLNAQYQQNPNTTTPIKHVVVIFQENVSFDHYFATYPYAANNTGSEPTFTAASNTPSVNGLTGPLLTHNPNSAQPFRLTRAQEVLCDQDHNYGDEQKAFDNGLMDKFVEATGTGTGTFCKIPGFDASLVMSYYDGNTVTALWNYAQNYAMSDNSFGTTFGPSTPGAFNLTAGTTHGATVTAGKAAGNVGSGGSVIGDPRPSLALDDCTIKTKTLITMSGKNVGDLLNAKGITWGWFQGGFKPSSVNADGTAVCAAHHTGLAGDDAVTTSGDYIPHHEPFQYFPQTANPHHLPPTATTMIGQQDQANHQYDTSDFFTALNAGKLPSVSYVKAAAYQDGHAGYSTALDEQTFVVTTVNAIMKSPFWPSTAIIIAYDDSDGFYDHVMGPIVQQSNTSDDNLTGAGACGTASGGAYQGRCGYGPRLPLLVISPYARVNYVDHTVTDQSSILRFVEDNWGLGRIGDQSSDAFAGPLNGMFNFKAGAVPAAAVILDPSMGVLAGSGSGSAGSTTAAVASPKGVSTAAKLIDLDATASTSVDGKPLTYQWAIAAGSPSATLLGAATATPSVQFDAGYGTYTFTLTVTDSSGTTSTDSATLTYIGHR